MKTKNQAQENSEISEFQRREMEYDKRQYSASFVERSAMSGGGVMQSVPSTRVMADSFEKAVAAMINGHTHGKIVAITLAQRYSSEYRFYDEAAIAKIMEAGN